MNKKINQKKYLEALQFAFKLHSKQFRKGTKIPYFFHLSSVSNHVIENGGNTDEAIAGLLHDAVEDQGGEKTLKLIKKVPNDFTIVGESGIKKFQDIRLYNDAGVYNFLIGESILTSKNIQKKFDELLNK